MSLLQIRTELASVLAAVDRHGVESPEAAAALQEHADALREAMVSKSADYCSLIQHLRIRASGLKGQAERIKALEKSDTALADRLTKDLKEAMEATGRTRIDTPTNRLAVVANGGVVPVKILDAGAIPEVYKVPTGEVKIDNDAIRQAIEGGTPVPGAELGTRGTRLQIQ